MTTLHRLRNWVQPTRHRGNLGKNGLLSLLAVAISTLSQAAAVDDLERQFVTPPHQARPWVNGFSLNGNLTRAGITADFEAMARVGIGGVLYMEVAQAEPKGPADFAGPLWRELFQHACKEAHRLGMEININNGAGWCGSGGPWITPELSMQKVVWSETVVEGGHLVAEILAQPTALKNFYRDIAVLAMPMPANDFRINDIETKALYKQKTLPALPATFTESPTDTLIPRKAIVNLTTHLDQAGRLTWDAPPGRWLVIRFGHTTTGKDNLPAPPSVRGLECDKFSKDAVAFHYQNLMGKVIADNRALSGEGKVLASTHIDSWEVGSQNWTPKMLEEFQRRRGYSLLPFLPTFTGRVVEGTEVTERFLWDLRQTVSELVVENYAGEFRRLANRDGLRLSIEAYDGVPADEMTYGGQADEPMCEFWGGGGHHYSPTEMASVAHTYGRRILAAEAFTSGSQERWLQHPGSIKAMGDWALCEGVNRFVFHRYALQPWTDRSPGMSMGAWGLHYERTQTWWEQSKAWHTYLARCQYLLRQGVFVADVVYLDAEGPRRYIPPPSAWSTPNVRGGYNFDGCTPEVVLTRMSVKDGRIVLPDGMSYRVLVLPEVETMTPRLLRRIKDLADAGATIIASSKPPVKSPSLADLGSGDAEVKTLAEGLWPKLVTGKTAAELLASRGIAPDFSATAKLTYIHRVVDETDLYFVANPDSHAIDAKVSFRITGKRPELWSPDTGRVTAVDAFTEHEGITTLPLRLDPSGSVFVLFRKPSTGTDPIVTVTCDNKPVELPAEVPVPLDLATGEIWQSGQYAFTTASGATRNLAVVLPAPQELTGAWEVGFDPRWGGPPQVRFDQLEDWSKRPEEGIRYYSGTALYTKTFTVPPLISGQRTYLDLGTVAVMAEVRVNGKDLGVLWKPPYRVDVTGAVHAGDNTLELKVVNLWVNRQIGDEQLPADCERNPRAHGALKSWPRWVQEGKPSPTGRFTFGTTIMFNKNDALVPSGLIGPVCLVTTQVIAP